MRKFLFITFTLLLSFVAVNAQTETSEKELRITSGGWGYNYFVGNEKQSAKGFMEILKQNEHAHKMFKAGKNLAVTGTVIGSVGAFFVGYDLGGRLGGGKGNAGMLVGGGIVTAGGIAMGLIGESKMKKAVKLFNDKKDASNLQIELSPYGMTLAFNF